MIRKSISKFVAICAVLSLLAVPSFGARGKADFTRYVALGDSFGAGFSNGSLVDAHQVWSYPAVIARQARSKDFQQPLVSQPGIPPELALLSLSPLVIGPKATTNGSPTNLNLPRPYNNLSIPGARAVDLTTLTGKQPVTGTATSFAQFILRGLGTPVDQALAQSPTFVSIFIGGNDVLGAVLGGTPALLTPLDDFKTAYTAALDRLVAGAPNAGMVTAGVPGVTFLPYANTVPPVLVNPATSQPVLGPDGKPIFLVADLGGGNFGQLPPGSLVLLPAISKISTGFGIPAALKPNFPNFPDVGKPLADTDVLTPTEIAVIETRAADVNAFIRSAAAARDIPFTDLAPLLANLKNGLNEGGVILNTSFLTGGAFGYDGFHPTDIGYTLIANEFIKTINNAYGTKIPQASLLPFFANNAPEDSAQQIPQDGMTFSFSLLTWESIYGISGADRTVEAPVVSKPAPNTM
ncbi:MAG: SGNH/GDSL hydrolase family protein [Acidobacteriota bacterium]